MMLQEREDKVVLGDGPGDREARGVQLGYPEDVLPGVLDVWPGHVLRRLRLLNTLTTLTN